MSRVPSVPLAWLNLTHNRVRMALFCAGIGFAVLLMFIQYGCRNALLDSSVLLIDKFNADLVVINRLQTTVLLHSTFSRSQLERARSIPGVSEVHPLYLEYSRSLLRNTAAKTENRGPSQTIRVIGIDPMAQMLTYPQLNPNSDQSVNLQLRKPGTVLFDELAKRDKNGHSIYGPVEKGTRTDLAGRAIEVVGFFQLGIDFGTNGTLITSYDTFRSILRSQPYGLTMRDVDIGLVRLLKGANQEKVQKELQALLGDGLRVLTVKQFKQREQRFWEKNTPIGAVFFFGVFMGFLVGLVICYQILSTDIRDNLSAYATLRAIGYPNRYLTRIVLQEAALLAVMGFLPGLVVAWLTYRALAWATDLPMSLWPPGRVLLILAFTLTMCIVSGLLAVRQAQQADPAEVF